MNAPAGLYVHVPFCLTRCGYCDFNTYAGLDDVKPDYLRALGAEAAMWSGEWNGVVFDSVFLGGGTPTTLDAGALVFLLDGLRGVFDVSEDAEVTIEANPDTVEPASLQTLRAGGFTRLSMGAQSFDPGVLAALERVHPPGSTRAAFEASRASGFEDVNLDLIYGAEGETLGSWRATLAEAVSLGPEHVSAYALTIEQGTPLGRQVATGSRSAPDPDLQAAMYEAACETLAGAGYRHYEVSNWALPGKECRHNLGYWRRRPYLGLGAGAHSFRQGRRWWNLRLPDRYLAEVAAGRRPVGGGEDLDTDQESFERLFLGMRSSAVGVTSWPREASGLVDGGLLVREGDRLVATDRGMFLANDLALSLAGG